MDAVRSVVANQDDHVAFCPDHHQPYFAPHAGPVVHQQGVWITLPQKKLWNISSKR